MEGKWLSVLEFATYKNKSISTVRRYIKADRVKYKEDNGKYFIWVKNYISTEKSEEQEILELKLENERLKKELRFLTDELTEVKMLISLYENNKMNQSKLLPELPALPSEM